MNHRVFTFTSKNEFFVIDISKSNTKVQQTLLLDDEGILISENDIEDEASN